MRHTVYRASHSDEMSDQAAEETILPFSDVADHSYPLKDISRLSAEHPAQSEPLLEANDSKSKNKIKQPLLPTPQSVPSSDEGHNDRTKISAINKSGNETIRRPKVHWLAPSVMVSSLLAAVLLAIGHHCYYRWLDGQAVGSSGHQQWSLR
jgi:hypothetical protein